MNLLDPKFRLPPVPAEALRDADAFLRWAEGREGRYELAERRITMVVGASKNHAVVTLRIGAALLSQLDPAVYQVCVADLGVRTKAGVRYPDILIDSAEPGTGSLLAASCPVFIAEVLSPSSIAIDMIEKAAEYAAIGSLGAYAVFSQDEPRAWIWSREETGWPDKPAMIEGQDGSLSLPALGITMPFASIYQGIMRGPASAVS